MIAASIQEPYMKIKCLYTKSEFAEAFWVYSKYCLKIMNVFWASISFFCLAFFLFLANNTFLARIVLGISTFFFLVLLCYRFLFPNFIMKKNPLLFDEFSLEFSDEGIHYKSAVVDSKISWAVFKSAIITKEQCLLFNKDKKAQFNLIPLRCFESNDQLLAFDSIIREKIKDITFARRN